MSSTHFLKRTFGEKERHGKTFYDKLPLPAEYKDKLLHKIVIDNGSIPPQKVLGQSYGSCVTASVANRTPNVFDITCHEDLRSSEIRFAELDSQFVKLNDSGMSQKQRLDLWDSMEPGFVLALFGSPDSTTAGIGCFSCPVCTQHAISGDAFGAPDWTDVFSEDVCKQYLGASTRPSHCLVGSLAHNTWEYFAKDRDTLIEGLMPVVMPEGKAIGCKPNNGQVFQMLFLPFQAEAPVGVFMDATTTFDEYRSAFAERRCYKNFIRLLDKHSVVFKAWFEAVNAQPVVYKVPLYSALPLWKTFPTTAHPKGTNLVGIDDLGPWLEQRSRFLRAMLDDMVCRVPLMSTPGDATARCMYRCWCDRVEECYPTELGASRPISRQAFLEELLPPAGGWPTGFSGWSDIFRVDAAVKLPPHVDCYTPVEVPIGADVPDGWEATRLSVPGQPSTAVDELAAFRKRRAGQVSTSSSPSVPTTNVAAVTPAAKVATNASAAVTVSPEEDANATRRPSLSVQKLSTLFQDAAPTGGAGTPGQFLTPPGAGYADPFGLRPTPAQIQQQGGMTESSALHLDPPSPKRMKETRFSESSRDGHADWQNPFSAQLPSYGSMALGNLSEAQVFSPGRAAMFAHPNAGYGTFQQPLFITNGALSTAKHARVQDSKITTSDLRRKCSTPYLQICLMMTYQVPKGYPMVTRSGRRLQSDELLYVRAPTVPTGIRVLTGFDHGNNGDEAAACMRAAIKIRWSSETTLMLISLPAHQWQSLITADFVLRGFRQSDWSMNADFAPPSKGEKKHSLLSFLPLLGDQFSAEFVPSGGIEWRLMFQWCRFIYYFYSMPGCKTGTDNYGGYDDTSFKTSEFGQTLLLMCRLLQNPALERLWTLRKEQCTVTFIRDMTTLFELLGEFLEHRAGMSVECCGLDEATFEGSNGGIAVVVPATMLPNYITGQPSNFVQKLEAYRTRMTETWGRDRYNENDALWSTPSASLLLRQSGGGMPPLITRRHDEVSKENREATARTKTPPKRSKHYFKNTTPVFAYKGVVKRQLSGVQLGPDSHLFERSQHIGQAYGGIQTDYSEYSMAVRLARKSLCTGAQGTKTIGDCVRFCGVLATEAVSERASFFGALPLAW